MDARRKLDHEVRARLRARDVEGAASRIVSVCGPGVLGYLKVALHDESGVRDAFASFCEAVWAGLRRVPEGRSFDVWSYRLAYRCAKRHAAASGSHRRPLSPSKSTRTRELERTRAATIVPLGAVEDAELLRRELSLEEQTFLTLRLDRGFGFGDIGWVLGRTGAAATEAAMRRSFARVAARVHRIAVARGVLEPRPVPTQLAEPAESRRSIRRG